MPMYVWPPRCFSTHVPHAVETVVVLVGEQRETELVLLVERELLPGDSSGEMPHDVEADPGELLSMVAQIARLDGAPGRVGLRVEVHEQLLAAVVLEPTVSTVLLEERELGCGVAHLQGRHVRHSMREPDQRPLGQRRRIGVDGGSGELTPSRSSSDWSSRSWSPPTSTRGSSTPLRSVPSTCSRSSRSSRTSSSVSTSLLLALRPDRTSVVFRVARLTGIVAITITFVVFHAVLKKLLDLESWALVADNLLHTIVPILAMIGWLVFGPRRLTSRPILWLSAVFPLFVLCIFTLIRGAIVGWYPYPFIDVNVLGNDRVFVNCVWIAVLYLGVAAALTTVDG